MYLPGIPQWKAVRDVWEKDRDVEALAIAYFKAANGEEPEDFGDAWATMGEDLKMAGLVESYTEDIPPEAIDAMYRAIDEQEGK